MPEQREERVLKVVEGRCEVLKDATAELNGCLVTVESHERKQRLRQ